MSVQNELIFIADAIKDIKRSIKRIKEIQTDIDNISQSRAALINANNRQSQRIAELEQLLGLNKQQ